ncbi:hypothetical protein NQ318_003769 [Aromia moschata]|uniref:ABC transmembrane type-1 domain-containing protein n=1 Tax=Aromia moschata TaxID=1265417 RepID=A0AAV8YJJ3_9CUCU|nr:hypothetical protein NQ318_003769 [Aromia moschata]
MPLFPTLLCRTQQEELRHSQGAIVINDTLPNSNASNIEIYNMHGQILNPNYHEYVLSGTSSKSFIDDLYESVAVNTSVYSILKTDIAMYIYGVLIIAAIVFTLGRSLLFFKVTMMSSKTLHAKMFHSLLQAPMRFF